MILFYVPGACSLASHIALIEAKLPYSLVKVERSLDSDKQTEDGRPYRTISPKGYVPALDLGDGTILTEGPAILAYIADRAGSLLARKGIERWRALEALAHMASELHGNFKPFFLKQGPEILDPAGKALDKHFAILAEQLGDKAFLVGDEMSIADAYLFVMLSWAEIMKIALPEALESYRARLKQRPSITRALAEEGLS